MPKKSDKHQKSCPECNLLLSRRLWKAFPKIIGGITKASVENVVQSAIRDYNINVIKARVEKEKSDERKTDYNQTIK